MSFPTEPQDELAVATALRLVRSAWTKESSSRHSSRDDLIAYSRIVCALAQFPQVSDETLIEFSAKYKVGDDHFSESLIWSVSLSESACSFDEIRSVWQASVGSDHEPGDHALTLETSGYREEKGDIGEWGLLALQYLDSLAFSVSAE